MTRTRKTAIAAGLVSCLALGEIVMFAMPTNTFVPVQEKQEVMRETVYDRDAYTDPQYYKMLKEQAEKAEAIEQTAENTIEGEPDPSNNVFNNSSWIYDEGYTKARAQEAASYGSDTDWFASVDTTLCRTTVLRRDSAGNWNVVAAFDCGVGLSEKDLGVSDSDETHTFKGIYKVDHKNEQLGGLKWWVCFLPCWTTDGLDDGQGFHNLYLGYPGRQSQGCTRLTDTNAKWVYDNLEIGSTVVVW